MDYFIGFVFFAVVVVVMTTILDVVYNRDVQGEAAIHGTALMFFLTLIISLTLFCVVGFNTAGVWLQNGLSL